MPNSNYIKGRRKEYEIVKGLKSKGFDIAQRSAGSKSPIDIFAIDIKNKKILFIQAKPDKMSKNKRKEIEDNWSKLNDEFIVEFRVI